MTSAPAAFMRLTYRLSSRAGWRASSALPKLVAKPVACPVSLIATG